MAAALTRADDEYRLYHIAVYNTPGRWPYSGNLGYGIYSEAIVLAPDEESARLTHPSGEPLASQGNHKRGADWPILVDKNLIHVAEIGTPNPTTLIAMRLRLASDEVLASLFERHAMPYTSAVVAQRYSE